MAKCSVDIMDGAPPRRPKRSHMEKVMVPESPRQRTAFSARRVALLASVAALGGAVLFGGPGGFDHVNLAGLMAPAQAAETAQRPSGEAAQRPAGFADLV